MKWVVLLVLLVLLVAGYMGWQQKQTSNPVLPPRPSTGVTASYTLAHVAEHADKNSCWLAIEGKVYDVTPWVASGLHPGKEAILQGCGKDATELFNTRPMGSKTAHSDRARKMLPKYYIGELSG